LPLGWHRMCFLGADARHDSESCDAAMCWKTVPLAGRGMASATLDIRSEGGKSVRNFKWKKGKTA